MDKLASQTATPQGWDPFNSNCPSRMLLDRIADRWTVLVLSSLDDGPRRFNQLRDLVGGISQKMLSQTLKGLERDGLVSRTAYAEVPPRVEYALTTVGISLLSTISSLTEWTKQHMDAVVEAQQEYDASHV